MGLAPTGKRRLFTAHTQSGPHGDKTTFKIKRPAWPKGQTMSSALIIGWLLVCPHGIETHCAVIRGPQAGTMAACERKIERWEARLSEVHRRSADPKYETLGPDDITASCRAAAAWDLKGRPGDVESDGRAMLTPADRRALKKLGRTAK